MILGLTIFSATKENYFFNKPKSSPILHFSMKPVKIVPNNLKQKSQFSEMKYPRELNEFNAFEKNCFFMKRRNKPEKGQETPKTYTYALRQCNAT
jgi:hypothetical protein